MSGVTTAWRTRQIIESSRDAFIEVDGNFVVTEWSRPAEQLLGWSSPQMVGQPITSIVAQKFSEQVEQGIGLLRLRATNGTNGSSDTDHDVGPPMPVEMELRHRNGSVVGLRGFAFATGRGDALRIGHFLHDRSVERATLAEGAARGRLHDPLTGLPGRELFVRRLTTAVAELGQNHGSVAVVVFDLDRFKAINDSMGHDAGDDLLVSVVSRLRLAGGSVRPLMARLGGDEFLALFQSDDGEARAEAEHFAKRSLTALTDPFDIGGVEVYLSASVGISATVDQTASATELLSNADAAMHETKAQGGGTHKVFGEAMRRTVIERMTTEHSLHGALDRQELTLFYQPVVDISAATTAIGVEALIRWQHPEQGLMSPDRFIPVAEESGLIIPIGAWVLEEACNQLHHWREVGHSGPAGIMEVNLSARQIDHPEIVATVEGILEATGLPPENLTLEITESALMRDAVSALQVLQALKSIGVSLAIDDFGTGYSSLSYLQRFPLDILKIDKSFVDGLDMGSGSEIVAAVINLAHALGLHVVAEGVETEQQLVTLRQFGCDYAQGYLFSRPVPAAELRQNFSVNI